MCQNVGNDRQSDPEEVTVASTEVEHYTGVDTADVPSAHWGGARSIAAAGTSSGLFIFGFLLAMLRGNHVGHVENWFS